MSRAAGALRPLAQACRFHGPGGAFEGPTVQPFTHGGDVGRPVRDFLFKTGCDDFLPRSGHWLALNAKFIPALVYLGRHACLHLLKNLA